jgi:hypothetical protein
MGLLLFVLLVVLIATFGLWDTLAAIMGAAALVALAIILGVAVVGLAAALFLRRLRG